MWYSHRSKYLRHVSKASNEEPVILPRHKSSVSTNKLTHEMPRQDIELAVLYDRNQVPSEERNAPLRAPKQHDTSHHRKQCLQTNKISKCIPLKSTNP